MAIFFNVVRQKVPSGDEAGMTKWFGRVRSGSHVTFQQLCRQVARHSTVTEADVTVVLKEMLHHVSDMLSDGNIAQLGNLGNLRLTAGSKGVENEEDFNLKMMKKPKVIFTPGKELRELLQNRIRYIRAAVVTKIIPYEPCTEEHY